MRGIIVKNEMDFFEETFRSVIAKHFILLDKDELEFIIEQSQMMTERDKGFYLVILLRLIGELDDKF